MAAVRIVLRSHYTGPSPFAASRGLVLLTGALLLPGCSLSVPMLGSDDAPATTGSIAAPVKVQQPLPQGLAYSDASKIGQAAALALWQVDSGRSGDWVNSATGSSGTLEGATAASAAAAISCRDFNTTVTSIGGVHRYSGKLCRADGGGSTLSMEAPA